MSHRLPPQVVVLAGVLLAIGTMHFLSPRTFDSMIPRVFPVGARRPLTFASGAAEVAAGALLLNPATRRFGGRFTQLLFLAVLPANIDVALRGGYPLEGFLGSATAAWLRVPMQIPLILWAGWAGRSGAAEEGGA